MIEFLAAKYFMDYVVAMQQAYKQLDARVELEFQNPPSFESSPSSDLFLDQPKPHDNLPSFYLHLVENGFALMEVRLQKQTRIRVSSWDNRIKLALPCENFEVFIDCRYFLKFRKGEIRGKKGSQYWVSCKKGSQYWDPWV